MPKKPSDQVISIRLELQETERALLDRLSIAYTADKVSESISQLTTFTNLYVLITLVEIWTGTEILYGTPNDVNGLINDFTTWYKQKRSEGQMGAAYGGTDPDAYDENAASVVGGFQNLINNILDAIFHPIRLG